MSDVFSSAVFNSNIISNTHVVSGAGITVDKLVHQHIKGTDFGLDTAATPVTSNEHIVHRCRAAGTISGAEALLWDSGTSTDIDFDFLNNGVRFTSGLVNIVHGTGDRTAVAGTISSASVVAGDVLTCEISAVTSSTGALGPWAQITIDENAA